ncbi:uncharacterized protein MKK02DRAFT_19718 [Dioszegia hungarica]|uniref:STEEP1 domain-containing protein n=1 Tax=Dioszegia hungarica TaxID=4972 RepID=A0AA38H2V3_9TREE|nr:uncharacterized protein MKK02DRAFT_19718 [Dioszegia hungarica]KAI9633085.1 hypothetical protein MKK02DRAFT_19718 [Dioszegia hungarica]
MPKVISRGTVASDEQARLTASAKAILRSYYCLCGDFVLVMQGKLDRLPQRKSDNAYIIRSQPSSDGKVAARKFKLNALPGQRIIMKRKGSGEMELRQQLVCSRCKSTVAYQTRPPPVGSSPFVYILKGSVTELQGRIPPDAFEDEPPSIEEEGVDVAPPVSGASEV